MAYNRAVPIGINPGKLPDGFGFNPHSGAFVKQESDDVKAIYELKRMVIDLQDQVNRLKKENKQ